jgi:hypothetical protein
MTSVVKNIFGLQKNYGLKLLALGLTLGASGAAHADYYGRERGHNRQHEGRHCEQRYAQGNRQIAPSWGRQQFYSPPQVVIYAAPRVVYQSVPGYGGGYGGGYASVPGYGGSYGGGYNSNPGYGGGYVANPGYGGGAQYGQPNRLVGSAVMGAAGGFLGSQIGHGEGRAAAIAAGAVAGWVLGGNLGGQ